MACSQFLHECRLGARLPLIDLVRATLSDAHTLAGDTFLLDVMASCIGAFIMQAVSPVRVAIPPPSPVQAPTGLPATVPPELDLGGGFGIEMDVPVKRRKVVPGANAQPTATRNTDEATTAHPLFAVDTTVRPLDAIHDVMGQLLAVIIGMFHPRSSTSPREELPLGTLHQRGQCMHRLLYRPFQESAMTKPAMYVHWRL